MTSDIRLDALCDYANGRVSVADLDLDSYISTENMLQNKEGICQSSGLPTVAQTQAFQPDDVLISNIRPYFKKIWFADRNGGCSNDVLVIRAKDACYPRFLYYLLSDDSFFDYATATGKGTKMPRGDKGAIMRYLVPDVPYDTQVGIADTLSTLDARIAVNKKINHHLEQMAQAIFKSWFVDFEPFGGVMPDDWHIRPFGSVVDISTKSRNPQSSPDEIWEHYSIPAFDGTHLPVFEAASGIKSNKYIVDKGCFLVSKLNPSTKRIWRPYCLSPDAVCSTEFIVYRAKDPRHKDFYYSVADSSAFSDFLVSHVSGSTNSRQRAIPTDTLAFETVVPSDGVLDDFCNAVAGIYTLIEQNFLESRWLAEMRDALLPRLMSGELSVSDYAAK